MQPLLRTHLLQQMTPRDLRNTHTTRNSCRARLPWTTWFSATIFTCWWRSPLVPASKFGLLTIKQHNATKKHLFLYPQGKSSALRGQSTSINIIASTLTFSLLMNIKKLLLLVCIVGEYTIWDQLFFTKLPLLGKIVNIPSTT